MANFIKDALGNKADEVEKLSKVAVECGLTKDEKLYSDTIKIVYGDPSKGDVLTNILTALLPGILSGLSEGLGD